MALQTDLSLSERLEMAAISTTRPLPPGTIFVPGTIELVCDGDAIHWALQASKRGAPSCKQALPPPDLLSSFWKLFDAQPGRILMFARQNGVLGLTEEGPPKPEGYPDPPHFPETPNRISGLEPLETWRALASQVRSILKLAAYLLQKKDIKPEHIAGEPPPRCSRDHPEQRMWVPSFSSKGLCYVCPSCLNVQPNESYGPIGRWAADTLQTLPEGTPAPLPGEPSPSGYFWGETESHESIPGGAKWMTRPFPKEQDKRAHIARTCLDQTVQDWLFRFPSTITMERNAGELDAKVEYRFGLLSAIALQLMQAIARKSVHLCSECKKPFISPSGSETERKPRADRDQFCDACKGPTANYPTNRRRNIAANRRADERRRNKRKRAQQMYARGIDISTIAEKLSLRNGSKTVQNWAENGNWNVEKAQTR
jgi:hypothetical protein